MNGNVHLLQESTVHLLRSLYLDKKLPVTQAMLSVLNGHYPALGDIFATLDRYKNEELVSTFIKENQDLIDQAKSEDSKKNDLEKNAIDEPEETNALFSSEFELVKPYKLMKAVAISEFEKSFSNEISNLCKEELIAEIESIQSCEEYLNSWAELKIIVKSKKRFSLPLRST